MKCIQVKNHKRMLMTADDRILTFEWSIPVNQLTIKTVLIKSFQLTCYLLVS